MWLVYSSSLLHRAVGLGNSSRGAPDRQLKGVKEPR